MDFRFYRNLVIINGLLPAVILAWDAWRGQLGANAVNNAIHITGVLSLVFLLLSLLITPLRVVTGWNSLIAYRRALGLYGFAYAGIHFAIYVAMDRMGSLASTWDEIVSRRYLTVGFVGLTLMLPLTLTSTNAMISKLGAVRWKLLHRAAYAVAALGVLHYYMLVKSDVRQPLAFAAVLSLLLGFRAVKHYTDLHRAASSASKLASGGLRSALRKRTTFWKGVLVVSNIHRETHDVQTFRLVTEDRNTLPFEYLPGQYLNLSFTIDGQQVRRSYTIASSPTQRAYLEIAVKRNPNGNASRYLHDVVKVGDRITVGAPAGSFHFDGTSANHVLLMAGGVGVTPIMAMLRYLTDRVWNGEVYFVYVIKSKNDLVFACELRSIVDRFSNVCLHLFLTRQKNANVDADADPCWRESTGYPTRTWLRDIVKQPMSTPAFLCGPVPMMDAMRKELVAAGFSQDQVHTEEFASTTESHKEAGSQPGIIVAARREVSTVPSTVFFQSSKKDIEIGADQSILEGAEAQGVQLPFECRSGICGHCKVKCLEGRVRMDVTDALSSRELDAGFILACQARALDSRIVVDA